MKILEKFRTLSNEKFLLSRSILIIAASFTANIFAYLFQLVSGRYFSKEDYGVLVALFSLSGIIPLILQFFTSGIPKLVAEIKDIDYPKRISSLFYTIFKINAGISLLILIGMLLLKNNIAEFLNIENTTVMYPFIFAVAAGVLTLFMTPYIQGLMRFKAYAFVTLLTSISKFLVALTVLLLGLTLSDIFWGLTITTTIMGIIAYSLLLKNLDFKWRIFNKPDLSLLIKYSLGGALALIGLNLVNSIDVILVKHYFSPEIAGTYSSISVIGRIIFYAASPVAIVMLPICAQKFKKGENFIKPFLAAIGISTIISGVATFLYAEFPHLIITTLFGNEYLTAEPYLGLFALFMLIYTILYIFATFLIATSKFKLSSLVIIASGLQYFGIKLFHANITQVIYVSIAAVSIVLVVYLFLFIGVIKHKY